MCARFVRVNMKRMETVYPTNKKKKEEEKIKSIETKLPVGLSSIEF